MSDDMNNRGPEGYEFRILGQEREFGYGPITGEDNVDHLVYLATMSDLLAVISAPILPPITVHIIDTDADPETRPGLVLEPPTLNSGHSAMREIADKVVDRSCGSLDELAAYRRRRRQQRIEEIRAQNTVPSHMHRNVPGPFNTTAFVKGMVRRSVLFTELMILGSMNPDVDADPDAMRAADMVRALTEGRRRAMDLFDPYTEGPDITDPAS